MGRRNWYAPNTSAGQRIIWNTRKGCTRGKEKKTFFSTPFSMYQCFDFPFPPTTPTPTPHPFFHLCIQREALIRKTEARILPWVTRRGEGWGWGWLKEKRGRKKEGWGWGGWRRAGWGGVGGGGGRCWDAVSLCCADWVNCCGRV